MREWWLPARLNILYRGFWKRCFIKDGGIIGGIAFGTFTVALIKLIAPATIDMIDSVSLPALHIMTCVIAFVMIADTVKTVKCMDSSKLWYVEKQAEFMDELRNGRCVGLVKKIKDTFRR